MALVRPALDVDQRVRLGDRVLLYETFDRMKAFDVTGGATHHTKAGIFRAEDLVGIPYGSKVYDTKGKGYLFVLRTTPELWTLAVKHQTQIVHISDISMVTFYLGLRPGSVVVESGTGTGSMSTSLIRSIFPNGHLFTFEYNESRADIARETFRQNGVFEYVTVQHKDVLKDGFGEELKNKVDAMFLDLPAPWDAIKHAREVLKEDARLCSYSPCIEQVQRTCSSLRSQGFEVITTIECLIRKFESRRQRLLGPLHSWTRASETPSGEKRTIGNTLQKSGHTAPALKKQKGQGGGELRARRQARSEEPSEGQEKGDSDSGSGSDVDAEGNDQGSPEEHADDESAPPKNEKDESSRVCEQAGVAGSHVFGKTAQAASPSMRRLEFPAHPQGLVQTRPWPEMRGHTAYLTFARKELARSAGAAE